MVVVVSGALAAGWTAFGQQSGFILIAHSTVDQDSLAKEKASDYFLKKDSRWDDGEEVKPVDLNLREVREAFSSEVHNRSLTAIKKYWQRQIFTGRGTPPPEKGSAGEVIQYVSSTPGALGYVPAGTKLPGDLVKVLRLR